MLQYGPQPLGLDSHLWQMPAHSNRASVEPLTLHRKTRSETDSAGFTFLCHLTARARHRYTAKQY
jgi:ABC-type transporter Mla MlaB component